MWSCTRADLAEAEDREGDSARARLHVPGVQDERAARRAVHHWPFDLLCGIDRVAVRHPSDPLDQSWRRRTINSMIRRTGHRVTLLII